MKVLINLIPIKKGGGQQVASNFVVQLLKFKEITPFFLVTKNTYIHKKLLELEAKSVFVVENKLISRFFFQSFRLNGIVKKNSIDIVYTMFGPGLHCKGIKSVTGCAYSNLFFPEIDFWEGHAPIKKGILKLIDNYRLSSTLKSDAIIFENEAMQQKVNSLFNYPLEQTKLILPSITEYSLQETSLEFKLRLEKINNTNFNLLMLTGWHKNKNIEIVPDILYNLKKKGIEDVSFVITVAASHPDTIKLIEKATKLGVQNNIVCFDSVEPNEVRILFEQINAVSLFSKLESFSNNIIEAWYFDKPLFISDELWSRAICKDAAIYVNRLESMDIAGKIMDYRKDVRFQETIMSNASKIIKKYPTPFGKVESQVNYLKEVLDA